MKKVKIKKWEDMVTEYDLVIDGDFEYISNPQSVSVFNNKMVHLCGTEILVSDGEYYDPIHPYVWNIDDWMCEPNFHEYIDEEFEKAIKECDVTMKEVLDSAKDREEWMPKKRMTLVKWDVPKSLDTLKALGMQISFSWDIVDIEEWLSKPSVIGVLLDEDLEHDELDARIAYESDLLDEMCFIVNFTDYIEKKVEVKQDSDNHGGSTDYYKLPDGAKDLQDLIEAKNMNFALGNVFKAIYRLGSCDHSDVIRDLNKCVWFINRELERVKNGINKG